jgi:hypothetical protein
MYIAQSGTYLVLKANMKSLVKTMLAAINERVKTGEFVQKKGRPPKQ